MNGLKPAGVILLSINVFKNTVVASSFHGRPVAIVAQHQEDVPEVRTRFSYQGNIDRQLLLSNSHQETVKM